MNLINWDELHNKYKNIQKMNEDIACNKVSITPSVRANKILELVDELSVAAQNLEKDLDNHLFLNKRKQSSKNENFFRSICALRGNKI